MKSYRIIMCILYLFGLHIKANSQTTDEAAFNQIFDIIFTHNFENDTEGAYRESEWKADWNNPTWANHALGYGKILMENSSKNLQISFPKGEMGMDSSGVQWHGKFSQGYDELYLTYKIKFSSGFTNKDLQGKLPGFSGAASNTGGSLPTGKDGWSTRYMFHGTELLFYLYYPEMYKDYGDAAPVPGKTYYGSAAYFQPGFALQPNVWYTVTQRVVMNTIGKSDGLVEGYLNGQLCAVKTGMRFRDISSIQIDRVNFGNFLGGSGKPPLNDEFIYYDDFCVFSYKSWVNVPRGTVKSPTGRKLFMPDLNQIKNWGENVSASNITSSTVDIQWVDYPLTLAGYIIERKASNETAYKNLATLAYGQTSYKDQNLEAGKSYTYRIKAHNNVDFTDYSKEISITTIATNTPVNNAPVIKDQLFTVIQDNFVNNNVGKVTASDPDAGQSIAFSIVSGNTSNIFNLNSSTGELSTTTNNIFKPGDTVVYALNIKVTDNATSPKNATATVTIKLIGSAPVIVNQNPVIQNQIFTIKQSNFSTGLIGKIVATDPDAGQKLSYKINPDNNAALFALNSLTGDLSTTSTNLFKAGDTISYLLKVTVTDNGTSPISSSADITVRCIGNPVVIVNNNPVIKYQTFSIAQDNFKSNLIGRVIASDPDAGQSLTYSILSGNTTGIFSINSSTGDLSTTTTNVFSSGDTLEHMLTVKVTDNGNTPKNSSASILVRFIGNPVPVVVNTSPVINNQFFTVYEQDFTNNFIGKVVASDNDPLQKITYSIVSGNLGNLFKIDQETGVLSSNNTNIFKNDTSEFNLVVLVTDNAESAKSSNATISVKLIGKPKKDLQPALSMNVYPNPSRGNIQVKVEEFSENGETENSNIRIEIRGMDGDAIATKVIESPSEFNLEQFDLSDLRNGIYVVSVKKANMTLSKRLIINK